PARAGGIAVAAVVAAVAVPSTVLATAAAVHHAYPRPLECSQLPPARSLTAVAAREPTADAIALNLFSHTAASSVFLKLVHAKVRFRTWLQKPPTQHERHARTLTCAGPASSRPGAAGWARARSACCAPRRAGQQARVVASTTAGAETLPEASTLSTRKVRVTAQCSEPTVDVVPVTVRMRRPFTSTR